MNGDNRLIHAPPRMPYPTGCAALAFPAPRNLSDTSRICSPHSLPPLRLLNAVTLNHAQKLGIHMAFNPPVDPITGLIPGRRTKARRALCGAMTQKGRPCVAVVELGRKRCRWHGGLSTGPTTEEGKQKVANNLPCVRAARAIRANPEPHDPMAKINKAAAEMLADRTLHKSRKQGHDVPTE